MADKTVNPTKKRLEEIEKELADLQSLKKRIGSALEPREGFN